MFCVVLTRIIGTIAEQRMLSSMCRKSPTEKQEKDYMEFCLEWGQRE